MISDYRTQERAVITVSSLLCGVKLRSKQVLSQGATPSEPRWDHQLAAPETPLLRHLSGGFTGLAQLVA